MCAEFLTSVTFIVVCEIKLVTKCFNEWYNLCSPSCAVFLGAPTLPKPIFLGAAPALAPAPAGFPTWPKPSRPMPIPNLSTSLALLSCCGLLLLAAAAMAGVGLATSGLAAAMLVGDQPWS